MLAPRRNTGRHVYTQGVRFQKEPEQCLLGSGQGEVGETYDRLGSRPKEIPGATENQSKA